MTAFQADGQAGLHPSAYRSTAQGLDGAGWSGNLSIMFLQFFTSLRDAQVPVTLREYLTLMAALDADLAEQSIENFYYLSRTALVKDERNLDKFWLKLKTLFKPKPKLTVSRGGVKKTDYEYNEEKKLRQQKTDAILDKISKSGYESLSKAEKEFLFNQSKNG